MSTSAPSARIPVRYLLRLLDWLRSEGTDVDQLLVMARLDRALVV